MDCRSMRSTGTYREVSTGGEAVQAFVPHPLPPPEPRLDLTPGRQDRMRRAEHALACEKQSRVMRII